MAFLFLGRFSGRRCAAWAAAAVGRGGGVWRGRTIFAVFALESALCEYYYDKFTHLLRYKNDALMVTYKTLNKDNSKLNCRIKGFSNFSPKTIILDNKLQTKINTYVINTANKNNTLIFYNQAKKSKILEFKNKKIQLIKSKVNQQGKFDIKAILKKLYTHNCRNLLIEGGDSLTSHLLKKRIFNKFYLFKSPKNLSKETEYLKFNSLDVLKKNYKNKFNLNLFLGKDKITLYKN